MVDLKGRPFYLKDEDIDWIKATIKSMSMEEKIGQLFCMNIRDYSDEMLDYMFDAMKVGGVMYRQGELESMLAFTQKLQGRSSVPVLIAANLEKGGEDVVKGGTQVGSEMAVAATQDEAFAEKLGTVCGREGRAAGVNWAFAPIIDIDYNFRNPITNTRTFGSDPDTVARMGSAYVRTIQEHKIAACIKHFPGDGLDERDQHLVSSINDFSCQEWDATYGKVYQACIEAGALTCMVGHILQPAYTRRFHPQVRDEEIMPATLSREIMTDLLREQLRFNGLICTDSSTMNGFSIPMDRSEAVPLSIACGADMFLFSRNMKEDFEYMKAGIEKGIISAERLEEALTRILAVKAALGIHKGVEVPTPHQAEKVIGCEEHKKWAEECSDQAITLVKEESGILPITPKRYKRILFYPIENKESHGFYAHSGVGRKVKEMLEQEGFEVTVFEPDPNFEGFTKPVRQYKENFDLCLYVINLATMSNQTVVRIEWQQPMGANCPRFMSVIPTVAVSTGNPYHLLDMPRVRTYINTYGSNDETLKMLVDKLLGRSEFKGVSPVDAFCARWDTRLQ